MKLAAHITFYYKPERLIYLKKLIAGLNTLSSTTTIYIYTNKKFTLPSSDCEIKLLKYNYSEFGKKRFAYKYWIFCVYPNFLKHPFHLTWENRKIIEGVIEEYDVQMYIEDDICFDDTNFKYWLKYKDEVKKVNGYLGFLRYEYDDQKKCFITDLKSKPQNITKFNGRLYLVNDVNPYCGMWIYEKSELKKFRDTKEWNYKFDHYAIREKSAIGWNGLHFDGNRKSFVPLMKNKDVYQVHPHCGIHHQPNNYISHYSFSSLSFPLKYSENELQS